MHPALWRHAQLNANHGLFEVTEGVWQVRGYDISNITFITGETGWVVIDPLTVEHTARAGYELVTQHLGYRPVTAVIYTHSHADHFGGVNGVTTQEDVTAGRCQVIAPVGFMAETIGENVIAGPAMGRRGTYQFGPMLPAGPKGHVDCGLGNSIPVGPPGLIAPTHDITYTGEEMTVDGVRIIFQLTPETEAPAEMNFFFRISTVCVWQKTARTPCTTWSRSAALSCATLSNGRNTLMKASNSLAPAPKSCSLLTTGLAGATTISSIS